MKKTPALIKMARARRAIARLEASQARPIRELLRDPNNAAARQKVVEIDDKIAALRADLSIRRLDLGLPERPPRNSQGG